jgi:hypothetical protein
MKAVVYNRPGQPGWDSEPASPVPSNNDAVRP